MSPRSAARYENPLFLLLSLACGAVFFDRLAGAVIGPPVIVAIASPPG